MDNSSVSRHYFPQGLRLAPTHLNVPAPHPTWLIGVGIGVGGDYTLPIRAALSVLCMIALAAGLVYAAPPGQIRVQVNLVNLFATVRDKHKAIVTGLKQDDFQLLEDG